MAQKDRAPEVTELQHCLLEHLIGEFIPCCSFPEGRALLVRQLCTKGLGFWFVDSNTTLACCALQERGCWYRSLIFFLDTNSAARDLKYCPVSASSYRTHYRHKWIHNKCYFIIYSASSIGLFAISQIAGKPQRQAGGQWLLGPLFSWKAGFFLHRNGSSYIHTHTHPHTDFSPSR